MRSQTEFGDEDKKCNVLELEERFGLLEGRPAAAGRKRGQALRQASLGEEEVM
jgi:hypothetical protein